MHLALGQFDSATILRLVIGGAFGAILGAYAATRVPSKPLRYVLAVWLVFLGGDLFYRGWSNIRR